MRKTAKTPNWSYIRKDSQIPIDRAAFWCTFYCSYLHLHTFFLAPKDCEGDLNKSVKKICVAPQGRRFKSNRKSIKLFGFLC